ncbi:hypothetical protein IEE94_14385 [Yimella sp. cx-573]|nr:hypothetical protein [Yimella sp. cx-573]
MIEQTLIPPVTVTELNPDTIHSATSRLGDAAGNAGERYQLDSMLTPAQFNRLPSQQETTWIREYFMTTTVEGYDQMIDRDARWARRWTDADPLAPIMATAWQDPASVGALFGVDLLVVQEGAVWRQVPGRPGLVFDGNLVDRTRDLLIRHLPWDVKQTPLEQTIFVVGAFARLGYLYDNRSARAASQAAGMIAGGLLRAAMASRRRAAVVDQFLDYPLNEALACDGVDRGLLTMIRTAPPQSEPEASNDHHS